MPSKEREYAELKKRYENLEANLSVKEFYNDNKSYCARHKIGLRALQNRISKEKWQSKFDINVKVGEKTEEIIEEIKKEIKADFKEEINELIKISLPELKNIILDEEINKSIKINAIKAVLDISGLKKEKVENEISGLGDIEINFQPVKVLDNQK